MMWQRSARISISRLLARAMWIAGCLCVLLSACKPGVFSSNPRGQADGSVRGADAGLEPGAAADAGSAPVGGGPSGPQAGSARAGSAATSRATAGSSGESAAQGGGASGKSAAQGGGGSGAAAQGGAAAASTAAGGRGATGGERAPAAGSGGEPPTAGADATAGAGGAPGPACPPADLSALRVNKLSDAVLSAPDPNLEISTGPAVRVAERMLMLLNTQSDGPLQGRSVAAWADLASLTSASPALSALTSPVLPDEPIENYISSQPTSAWLADESNAQSVQFLFTRYYIVAALGAGLARSSIVQPAPAQIEVPIEQLFKPQPAANGGMDEAYRPRLLSGGLRIGELRYFYVCNPPPGTPADMTLKETCRAARVLSTQVQDGARYEFWRDGQWVPELERATPVLPSAGASVTVLPNAYLHKLLAVYSGVNNDVRLAWADAPQGPFHELAEAIPTVPGTGGAIKLSYGAAELPLEHADCDPEILVWYSVPLEDPVAGAEPRVRRETRVMRLRLSASH